MIVAAHQTMLAPQGAPLPYDAEVEWLQGVSGGYIIIPWAFATTDRWEMDAQFPSQISYNGGYYNFSSIDRIDIAYESSTGKFRLNYGPPNDVQTGDTSRHLFVLDALNNRCSIDANIYSLPGTHISVPSNRPYLGILGRILLNRSGTPSLNIQGAGCRLFSSRIFRNDSLQIDLHPVRIGTVGYLYDRVSGQLFGNAGTGAFTIGPDK